MFRHWLLTSTFYGNWLPGDARGFVGRVRDGRPDDSDTKSRLKHNAWRSPYDKDMPGLKRASAELMKGPPVIIESIHAEVLLAQFRQTTEFRGWRLLAVAIMKNHVHAVVRAPEAIDQTKILGDLKAYGSGALSLRFGKPVSGTWWTYGGSKRLLSDNDAVDAAINYVLHKQIQPLVTWAPA